MAFTHINSIIINTATTCHHWVTCRLAGTFTVILSFVLCLDNYLHSPVFYTRKAKPNSPGAWRRVTIALVALLINTTHWFEIEINVDCRTNKRCRLTVASLWPTNIYRDTKTMHPRISRPYQELVTQPRLSIKLADCPIRTT